MSKRKLLTDIGSLVGLHQPTAPLRGAALAHLPSLESAWLLIENGRIAAFGSMQAKPDWWNDADLARESAGGGTVLPAWCDSHSHLVFAESREGEFVDKLRGLSYADIAAKGGGILNSANKLAACSEDELLARARKRLQALIRMGTGALEIKSGYGLNPEAELKMLRVIRRLQQESNVAIRSTFLGAHAYPTAFREDHPGYINQLIQAMLPAIAEQRLADYVDVFCETGFFSVDEMEAVVRAAHGFGLTAKLHVNQLNSIGGLQRAIALNALSVDHLETMTEQDIVDLAASDTIGTLLPTAAFFLRMPYQPARALIDAGAAVALASDYNPGSSPSGNMHFVVALACIQMKMLPEEAINAATINGAFAMGVADELGSIHPGKWASLQLTDPIPALAYIPYSFGASPVKRVMIQGEWID